MFGGDKQDVMGSLAGNVHARDIQRLRIDVTINAVSKELAEGVGIDVGGSQQRFVQVLAGAGIIVVVGQHIDLSQRRGKMR